MRSAMWVSDNCNAKALHCWSLCWQIYTSLGSILQAFRHRGPQNLEEQYGCAGFLTNVTEGQPPFLIQFVSLLKFWWGREQLRFCYFIPLKTVDGKEFSVTQREGIPHSKEEHLRQYWTQRDVKDDFFFSRYLQERLKQLQEEVNLLKSNITKYKVTSSQCIYHLNCALLFVEVIVHSWVYMH